MFCYDEFMNVKQGVKKYKVAVVSIIAILAIAVVVGYVITTKHSSQPTSQTICEQQDRNLHPNGCPPPGYCDAPADGYMKCDKAK